MVNHKKLEECRKNGRDMYRSWLKADLMKMRELVSFMEEAGRTDDLVQEYRFTAMSARSSRALLKIVS